MSNNFHIGIPEADLPVKKPSGAARVRYVEDGKSYSSAMPDVIAASALVQDAIDGIVAGAESDISAIVNGLGYLPPVAFASGLNVDSSRFTVTYSGVTYAPNADAIPFTTTGTFNPAQWRVIQGVTATDLAGPGGAELVGFSQFGGVQRSVADKLSDFISATDYGVIADGVTDNTAALQLAINKARSKSAVVRLPAGTILTTSAIDISGVTLVGVARGYRNANGTVIQGSGGHDILVQVSAGAEDTRIDIHNIRIKGGLWGVKTRYLLHSHWSNVHVTDCENGIQIGNNNDAGPLFNTFDNIETHVSGCGVDVNGNQFANANSFNQCFFWGDQYGGRVRCNGGIGAVDNVFNCTEFSGARYGCEIENTSNTVFNQCYFESAGPSMLLSGRNTGWSVNDAVFAHVSLGNPTGRTAFIYHAGSSTSRGSIKGGYVYIPALPEYNNLSFIASDSPLNFFLHMSDQPEFDVSASGFSVLNGLVSGNLNVNDAGSYNPVWGASSSPPAISDGTLTGSYARSGNVVTATITMSAGAGTSFGVGAWEFSLPYPAKDVTAGSAYILDSGTGYYSGVALVSANSSSVSVYLDGTPSIVQSMYPMAWQSGDSITITITYQC